MYVLVWEWQFYILTYHMIPGYRRWTGLFSRTLCPLGLKRSIEDPCVLLVCLISYCCTRAKWELSGSSAKHRAGLEAYKQTVVCTWNPSFGNGWSGVVLSGEDIAAGPLNLQTRKTVTGWLGHSQYTFAHKSFCNSQNIAYWQITGPFKLCSLGAVSGGGGCYR